MVDKPSDIEGDTSDDDLQEILDEVMMEGLSESESDTNIQERLAEAHKLGELQSLGVRCASSEIVGSADESIAQDLYARHRILNRAREVASKMYAAFFHDDSEDWDALYKRLPREGGFFEDDSVEHYRSILADPEHYVVARAGGRIRDPQSMDWRDFRVVSDMQVQIPDDTKDAELVTKVPEPKKHHKLFHDHNRTQEAKDIANAIHRNPAIAACITNVGVAPNEYRGMRFASLARKRAVAHLDDEVNPNRRNKIRYLIANMFRLKGLWLPKEQKNLRLEKPVANDISIEMHWVSQVFDSIYAWRLGTKRGHGVSHIPVSFADPKDGEIKGKLLLDWETVVLDMKNRRGDPTPHDGDYTVLNPADDGGSVRRTSPSE